MLRPTLTVVLLLSLVGTAAQDANAAGKGWRRFVPGARDKAPDKATATASAKPKQHSATRLVTARESSRAAARGAPRPLRRFEAVTRKVNGAMVVLGTRRTDPGQPTWMHGTFVPRHPAVKRGIRALRAHHEKLLSAASRQAAGGDADRRIKVEDVAVVPVYRSGRDADRGTLGDGRTYFEISFRTRSISRGRLQEERGEAYVDHAGNLVSVEMGDDSAFQDGIAMATRDVADAAANPSHALNKQPHRSLKPNNTMGTRPPALERGIATLRADAGARTFPHVASHRLGWRVTFETARGKQQERVVGFDGRVLDASEVDTRLQEP